jgi:hypothetical protein
MVAIYLHSLTCLHGIGKVKRKVNYIKHYAMKAFVGVDLETHIFI